MGPVEVALRRELRAGKIVSRVWAKRKHGTLALVLLDKWVDKGIAERDGDSVVFVLRVVPETTIDAVNRRLRELPGQPAPDLAAAERRRAQREALRVELAGAKTIEDRARVVQRSQALALADQVLADLPAIEASFEGDLGGMFGIEFDVGDA